MNFQFVTLHPEFIEYYFKFGLFKKALDLNIASFKVVQLRDFAIDDHGSVDSKPYGGGTGMVLRPEPLAAATKSLKKKHPNAKVVLLSPQGSIWNQKQVYRFAENPEYSDLIFICGRFEGTDQRYIDKYVDLQVSVGHYILSGGEVPALAVADSLLRHCKGLLKNETLDDSQSIQQNKPTAPAYSRPEVFEGTGVPKELISGDHALIKRWKNSFS